MFFIPRTVQELLSDEDVFLLEKHGEMLQALVLGEVEPRTENQRKFVNASKYDFENSDGVSSKTWKKYTRLISLIAENKELKESLKKSDAEIAKLKASQCGLEKYVEILKTDVRHKGPYEWNQQVLEELSDDNIKTLRLFENAIILNEVGSLDEKTFAEFSSKSGLWIALHNYNKLLNPRSEQKATRLDSGVNSMRDSHICGSCGTVIVNGYCKCSD